MNSTGFKYIFILLLLFSISKINTAQVNESIFEHFTVNEGLSQSTVNCIKQDRRGFLWFGTQDGLNKFDGYKFKYYQHNPLDTNSISSNWIYSIDDDNSGIIWIGTQKGLNKLDRMSDKITRFVHNPKVASSLCEDEVFGVLVDRKGKVWVKTEKSLSRLDTASGKFTRFEHEVDYFDIKKTNIGYPMIEDENGIWMGSSNGLHFFNTKLEQFKTYQHDPNDVNSLSNDFVTGLLLDKNGNLWVSTKYGLNKLNKKTKKFEHFFHDYTDPGSGGISENSINSIYYGHDGFIWICTNGGGLNKFSPTNGKVFEVYRNQENNDISLSENFVNCVFEDRSYNLWIGTASTGLDKLDLKPNKFQLFKNSHGPNSLKLSENIIGSIFVPNDETIWIGTWDMGLDILNRTTGSVKNYSTSSPEGERIIGDNVHSIIKDSRNLIWLGTKNGVSVFDIKNKKFYNLEKYFNFLHFPNLSDNRIYAMYEDFKGNVWVGTQIGLYLFDMEKMDVMSYRSNALDSTSLFSNHIVTITGDNDGYIWIGTNAGLNRFDYKTKKLFRIGNTRQDISSNNNNRYYQISNPYVYELLVDSLDGSIWIGTASGLNKYDKRTGTFQYFTEKNGLPNETIYEIKQDKKGNLWLSTNRGIAMLDRKTYTVRAFDRADGLQGLEFNNGASFKTNSGEMFFGGTNGFNSFYPEIMHDNPFIPDVVFTTFEKMSSNKRISVNLEKVKELVLDYSDHSLTFNFSALEFSKTSKNHYMYMMEGLNNTWVNIGSRNFQDFGTLAPGEYVLRVKGSNNDLIWNNKEISIKIKVLPPVWKTPWAYGLYILIVLSIVYIYVRNRTKKLQSANDTLRTKQLAALEIAKQREELAAKNKNITDSINYAKRIQEAMLPSEYLFRKLLPDSFIFFNPKDIVSGDFYWVTEKESKIFIAAVDCTGHGVPGAFMSIIGYDLLRNITKEQGVENPSQILNLLNLGISETFSKHANESSVKDGMDVSLLVIDRNNKLLEYAGAFNPLYIARDNKIIEVKGNRFAVGKLEGNEDNKFDNHVIPYKDNDMVYIFSDGYADQFGGPLGKKFKFRRFRHLLLTINSLPLMKQKSFLEENFDSWKGQLEQVDDILVIGIRL